MPRGVRELYVAAVVASTFDIDSTIYGITVKGWLGFGESNHIIRLLYPFIGVWAPVAFLPIEAAGYVGISLITFMFGLGWRLVLGRGVPSELPRILYLTAMLPIAAAVGNLLFVVGFL